MSSIPRRNGSGSRLNFAILLSYTFLYIYIYLYIHLLSHTFHFRANGLLGNRDVYAGMAFNTETAIILVYYFLLYNSIAYVHGECTCK